MVPASGMMPGLLFPGGWGSIFRFVPRKGLHGNKCVQFIVILENNTKLVELFEYKIVKIAEDMSNEDLKRLKRLIQNAKRDKRSDAEVFRTFKDAGIIDTKGNLKEPYKNLQIPVK